MRLRFGSYEISTLFRAGVPLALAVAALIARGVPDQTPHRDPVDGGGALLLIAGSVALLYGIVDGPVRGCCSWQVPGSGILAILLLAGFVWYEARREHPMLDPRLLSLAGVRTGALGIVAVFFVLFGFFYINAQYLQDVKGYSALLTGVCILPIALVVPLASARSTGLTRCIGVRVTIILGLVALTLGGHGAVIRHRRHAVRTVWASARRRRRRYGPGDAAAVRHDRPRAPADPRARRLGPEQHHPRVRLRAGVAVLSAVLTARFAEHLPAALERLPGARGRAIRLSITAALHSASSASDPLVSAHLLNATHAAFTSATSLGLHVGVALLLLTTVLVALQPPND